LTISSVAVANAGDFAPPLVGPPVVGPPAPGPYGYGAPAVVCRFLLERRIDPYGREIVHRIRMCDDGPVYPALSGTVVPEYGYPPPPRYVEPVPSGYYGGYPPAPRYVEPAPSGYYGYPRPPAPIGTGYYY